MRPDGRQTTEIRPISCEVGLLPRTHGSALFTRGQTQVLSIVTLGSIGDKQKLDGLGLEESKRFMHHYNFPPFSVGEVRPLRSPGRREIGHGTRSIACRPDWRRQPADRLGAVRERSSSIGRIDLPADRIIVAQEQHVLSPARWKEHQEGPLPVESVPHLEFKQLARHATGCVRTGDSVPYANVLLVGG